MWQYIELPQCLIALLPPQQYIWGCYDEVI